MAGITGATRPASHFEGEAGTHLRLSRTAAPALQMAAKSCNSRCVHSSWDPSSPPAANKLFASCRCAATRASTCLVPGDEQRGCGSAWVARTSDNYCFLQVLSNDKDSQSRPEESQHQRLGHPGNQGIPRIVSLERPSYVIRQEAGCSTSSECQYSTDRVKIRPSLHSPSKVLLS